MENWKVVPETNSKIFVSDAGRIKSFLRDERILKATPDDKGYLRIKITIDRVTKSYKVHRLVANAFIPNPDKLPQVNHIDGDKNNNRIDNLEWVTNIENCHHAIENGLWDSFFEGAKRVTALKRKPVIAYKDGESIRFESVCAAQDYFDSRHISDVLKGKRDHVKGWSFRYEGGDN